MKETTKPLERTKPLETNAGGAARFDFGAPTTARNAGRVLRALQLRKAVLLEGSPGVGKTSLVAALAAASGACILAATLTCTVA